MADASFGRIRPSCRGVLANRLAQLPDFLTDFLVFPKPVEQRIVARGSDIAGAGLLYSPHDGAIGLPRAACQHKGHEKNVSPHDFIIHFPGTNVTPSPVFPVNLKNCSAAACFSESCWIIMA
jgi:hypothetical protein